ncbi:ABC transporter ATP-binding protein [Rugosibacter aromaticivorans]|uniref:ABC transporter ATP-binding protein n=1 Tax=Rugosibacter aromaticivorans TaxID=1565605 RepID=UPI000A5D5A2B|nr:ABC transporter ATP-binding protein [Rugosibacter aromaticivorans]
MHIVRVEGVFKDYFLGNQIVQALSNITLHIEQGVFLAISGPSGSGKTTLLNIIGCIDAPTEGKIFIKGQNVTQWSGNQLADVRACSIGFIFQTFNLLPVLSAAENVEYPLLYRKDVSKKERQQRVKYFLDMVGLSKYANHRPGQMSGGQRQRVAIARALAIKPVIILADEPTANLDRITGTEILHLMKDINHKLGTTFIFSTHDQRVIDMADRLVRIEDGVLRELGVRRGDQWTTVRLRSTEESAVDRAMMSVTEKGVVHG